MNCRVGPFDYRVRFVDGYIRFEGDDCLGLCDNDRHELLVSDRVGPAQQLQVLCHEYMEAWLYHFGRNPRDKEDWCDLFGLAMTQFVMDLARRGRNDGLWELLGHIEEGATGETLSLPATLAGAAGERADPPKAVTAIRVTDLIEPGDDAPGGAWRIRLFEPVPADPPNEGP